MGRYQSTPTAWRDLQCIGREHTLNTRIASSAMCRISRGSCKMKLRVDKIINPKPYMQQWRIQFLFLIFYWKDEGTVASSAPEKGIKLLALALPSERLQHVVMVKVPDRWKITEIARKGRLQRAIGALVNRPLETVNRIVEAFWYEGHIHDAPGGVHQERRPRTPFLSAREARWNLGQPVAGQKASVPMAPWQCPAASNEALSFPVGHASWTANDWLVFSDESMLSMRPMRACDYLDCAARQALLQSAACSRSIVCTAQTCHPSLAFSLCTRHSVSCDFVQ